MSANQAFIKLKKEKLPENDGGELSEEQELDAYVRQNIVRSIVLLAVLLCLVGVAGVAFEAELFIATNWVYEKVGILGLLSIILFTDSITTPITPDLVLIVVAKSQLHTEWWWIVPMIGLVSTAAGNIGFFLGSKLAQTQFLHVVFSRSRQRNEALVARYGGWAVALGAFTPIPFSVTCWAAGMFHMRWYPFFWVSLLRVPRCLIYYAAIANSDSLIRALF